MDLYLSLFSAYSLLYLTTSDTYIAAVKTTQVASALIPVRTLRGCFKVNNPRAVATVLTISEWEVLVYYLSSVF